MADKKLDLQVNLSPEEAMERIAAASDELS